MCRSAQGLDGVKAGNSVQSHPQGMEAFHVWTKWPENEMLINTVALPQKEKASEVQNEKRIQK